MMVTSNHFFWLSVWKRTRDEKMTQMVTVQQKGPSMGQPELPNGLFEYQKSPFGYILEGRGVGNAGICNGHLEYITVIWYIL
jgi:hypothetical protein